MTWQQRWFRALTGLGIYGTAGPPLHSLLTWQAPRSVQAARTTSFGYPPTRPPAHLIHTLLVYCLEGKLQ